ncbi:MAG: DUF2970 domain-containing protein [Gammaproteobacteria bacterium]|nr:DUF2970 domain-containing protein [Gammaproteobacteria bacterium]
MSEPKTHGLWTTFKGVMAGLLGVQSHQQHEQDFTQGKASHFIVIGLIVVIVFILVVVGVVNIVLSTAT